MIYYADPERDTIDNLKAENLELKQLLNAALKENETLNNLLDKEELHRQNKDLGIKIITITHERDRYLMAFKKLEKALKDLQDYKEVIDEELSC